MKLPVLLLPSDNCKHFGTRRSLSFPVSPFSSSTFQCFFCFNALTLDIVYYWFAHLTLFYAPFHILSMTAK
jgi:hypothetical protein